jgi:anthranilate phosphoribosyltransferase
MKNTRSRTVRNRLATAALLAPFALSSSLAAADPEVTAMIASGDGNMSAIKTGAAAIVVAILGLSWLIFGGKKVKPQGK